MRPAGRAAWRAGSAFFWLPFHQLLVLEPNCIDRDNLFYPIVATPSSGVESPHTYGCMRSSNNMTCWLVMVYNIIISRPLRHDVWRPLLDICHFTSLCLKHPHFQIISLLLTIALNVSTSHWLTEWQCLKVASQSPLSSSHQPCQKAVSSTQSVSIIVSIVLAV